MRTSNCCDALVNPDLMVCTDCKEPCDIVEYFSDLDEIDILILRIETLFVNHFIKYDQYNGEYNKELRELLKEYIKNI